uniref:Serine/threonine-protein kinase Nek4 n=1 Tax=Lygus hesperus TaxID=30085 RepID=A0A0A9VXU7_LYGHE
MILYYLVCDATLPSQLSGGNLLMSSIAKHSPYPRPPEMLELIKAMLHKDPKRRPSCEDILRSPTAQRIIRSLNSAASTSTTTTTTTTTAGKSPPRTTTSTSIITSAIGNTENKGGFLPHLPDNKPATSALPLRVASR